MFIILITFVILKIDLTLYIISTQLYFIQSIYFSILTLCHVSCYVISRLTIEVFALSRHTIVRVAVSA